MNDEPKETSIGSKASSSTLKLANASSSLNSPPLISKPWITNSPTHDFPCFNYTKHLYYRLSALKLKFYDSVGLIIRVPGMISINVNNPPD